MNQSLIEFLEGNDQVSVIILNFIKKMCIKDNGLLRSVVVLFKLLVMKTRKLFVTFAYQGMHN